mmetsp:Transcript_107715/g.313517  ORF Transcript_107715/g.313517 Transcript_107715/m.313517 type:complete len:164 (-) Transcript_107715:157-648(-)
MNTGADNTAARGQSARPKKLGGGHLKSDLILRPHGVDHEKSPSRSRGMVGDGWKRQSLLHPTGNKQVSSFKSPERTESSKAISFMEYMENFGLPRRGKKKSAKKKVNSKHANCDNKENELRNGKGRRPFKKVRFSEPNGVGDDVNLVDGARLLLAMKTEPVRM